MPGSPPRQEPTTSLGHLATKAFLHLSKGQQPRGPRNTPSVLGARPGQDASRNRTHKPARSGTGHLRAPELQLTSPRVLVPGPGTRSLTLRARLPHGLLTPTAGRRQPEDQASPEPRKQLPEAKAAGGQDLCNRDVPVTGPGTGRDQDRDPQGATEKKADDAGEPVYRGVQTGVCESQRGLGLTTTEADTGSAADGASVDSQPRGPGEPGAPARAISPERRQDEVRTQTAPRVRACS